MGLEILQPPQVHRFARTELAHDDAHHRVIGPGGQVAVSRIAPAVDELADDIFDVGARPVWIAERPNRVEPTSSAGHFLPQSGS